jgi:Rhodanese-like domain
VTRLRVFRLTFGSAVTAAVLLLGAAPAAPPEHPVTFIRVEALKALLDQGKKVDVIDVRRWDSYVKSHIKGARSMPVRIVNERAHEISKTGLIVFY